jgi:hypothetical protein
MRIFATLLFTLTLAACAKPPGPDASTPPASDDGGTEDQNASCDFLADPNKTYVGQSPDQCATIRFVCEEGKEYFADDCGCGCQTVGG